MSEEEYTVKCSSHGETSGAFICQHLMSGAEKLGFHLWYDPESPDSLHPDAWCADCEVVLSREGEWNEAATAFADIKIVCGQCYEGIRDKNWVEDEQSVQALIANCREYLEKKQPNLVEQFKLNVHERWDWDQSTGKLIFSHGGEPQVVASVQFAGSFSTETSTWMWAWANGSLDDNIKAGSKVVRDFGQQQGYRKLAAGHWPADVVDAWEMTAVLAKHIDAMGFYRTPSENGYLYMAITDAVWVVKG